MERAPGRRSSTPVQGLNLKGLKDDGDYEPCQMSITEHATETFNFLYTLWKEKNLCDLVITCEGKEFWAHRVALAPHSDYFATKFRELRSTDVAQLTVNETSGDAVQTILEYIYTARLHISSDIVESVLSCADQLGIDVVISKCKDTLLQFTPENVIPCIYIAEKYNLVEVQEKAYKYVLEFFPTVAKTKQFLDSKLSSLMVFLVDDNLRVSNELEVFYIALNWIEHDRENRVEHIGELMGGVRLGLISPEDLHNHVESVDYVADCPDVAEMMFEAYKYHSLKHLAGVAPMDIIPAQRKWVRKSAMEKAKSSFVRNSPPEFSPSPMTETEISEVESLAMPGSPTTTINTTPPEYAGYTKEVKSPKGNRAIETPTHTSKGVARTPSRTARSEQSVDHRAYVRSRARSTSPPRKHGPRGRERMHSPQHRSSPRLPLKSDSNHHSHVQLSAAPHSCFVSNKYLYTQKYNPPTVLVTGGINMDHLREEDGKTALALKNKGRLWEDMQNLPLSLHHHAMFTVENFLYVVGGSVFIRDHPQAIANPTNSLYKYDPRTRQWQRGMPMYYKRMYHSVAVVNKTAYVMGGQNERDEYIGVVECFNTKSGKWTRCRTMPSARIGIAVEALNDKIMAVGGFNDSLKPSAIVDSVDCFIPSANKWQAKCPLETPRCHASLVNVNQRLFLIGGVARVPHRKGAVASLQSIEMYYEKQDVWEYITDMSVPRHDFGTASVGSKIYVIGGYSTFRNQAESTVECYDVSTGEWEKGLTVLPYSAVGLKAIAFAESEAEQS